MLKILLLSDIHFLYCEEHQDRYRLLKQALLNEMDSYAENNEIDALIVCGDIAFSGQETQYKIAEKYFEEILKKFSSLEKKPLVFVVPGNHDIDRTPCKYTRRLFRDTLIGDQGIAEECLAGIKKSEIATLKMLYRPFKAYNDFADKYSSTEGVYSHGPYFEWKHMAYAAIPKILSGGKEYPRDNVPDIMGGASTSKNFMVARYAEALLLYAEACIGADEASGLKALNEVQERSGSGKISTSLTFDDVMEEKQYEMWFENCRFPDLVRWGNQGKVNLDEIFNTRYGGIHKHVPTVFDEFFVEGKPGYQKEHKLYTEYSQVKFNDFSDKYKYLPFPLDCRLANKLKNVLGWESLNGSDAEAEAE